MIFGREPVLWLTGLAAVLNLFVGFGLGLSAEQVSLIGGAAAAGAGLVARKRVAPVK